MQRFNRCVLGLCILAHVHYSVTNIVPLDLRAYSYNTTFRFSAESERECRNLVKTGTVILGVSVWGNLLDGENEGTNSVDEIDTGILILDEQLCGLNVGDWDILFDLDDFSTAVGFNLDGSLGLGDRRSHCPGGVLGSSGRNWESGWDEGKSDCCWSTGWTGTQGTGCKTREHPTLKPLFTQCLG